jgi:hypothetical protein
LEINAWQILQYYRERADTENVFDELKNQWGFSGFCAKSRATTELAARLLLLVYNLWVLFVRFIRAAQAYRSQTRPKMVPVDRRTPRPIRPAKGSPGLHSRRLGPAITRRLPAAPRMDSNNCAAVENRRPCHDLKSVTPRPKTPLQLRNWGSINKNVSEI